MGCGARRGWGFAGGGSGERSKADQGNTLSRQREDQMSQGHGRKGPAYLWARGSPACQAHGWEKAERGQILKTLVVLLKSVVSL